MCLGHVYIVVELVGSARLTFDDNLYYELCDLMYRSLFGDSDEITDRTRSLEMFETYRLIYWKAIFGYRKGSEWLGYFSEYRRVTGIRIGP